MKIRLFPILCLLPAFLQADVIISEFLASNAATILDHEGDPSDYIELYNDGSLPTPVAGLFLTDDADNLTKWRIPSKYLAPGDYMLIFASGKDLADPAHPFHANFKLAREGEYLALVAADGVTILDEFVPEYPEQYEDTAYGVWESNERSYLVPSPGAANTVRSSPPGTPTFSHPHGFYETGFTLHLDSVAPGAKIYYTLDGSVPDAASDRLYNATLGIQILDTKVVRAMAQADGVPPSAVATASYIFPASVVAQTHDQSARGFPDTWVSTRSDYSSSYPRTRVGDYEMDPTVGLLASDLTTVPTVSLVLPNDDLWDSQNGIYINSHKTASSDRNWERACSIEYLDPDSDVTFSEEAGLRIFGGAARFPSLSDKQGFRVVFRSDYGPGRLESDMFERVGPGANRINTIVLRSHWGSSFLRNPEISGWAGETDAWECLYMRDVFANETYRATGQLASRSMMVHLYLNGVYFGLYEAVERPDDSFNAENRGGSDEDYDVIKGDSAQRDYNGILHSGSMANYRYLFSFFDTNSSGRNQTVSVPHTITDAELAIVSQYLDLEAFCDYMISLWILNRLDFPNKNWYGASKRGAAGEPPEEPFIFFTWDSEATLFFDASFNRKISWDERSVVERWNQSPTHDNGQVRLYRRLKRNEKFRRLWADRAYALMFGDGPLTAEKNVARWDKLAAELDRAIVAESARWGDWVPLYKDDPITRDDWLKELALVRDFVIVPRNDLTIEQMREVGIYPDLDPPQVENAGGVVWPGEGVALTAGGATGDIHYTFDGGDPREGGTVYATPIVVDAPLTLKTATVDGSAWSAAMTEHFVPIGGLPLAITEIMYHPGERVGVDPAEVGDLEFIEITNVGPNTVSLRDVALTRGIRFAFIDGMVAELAAGESVLVVRDRALFEQVYGPSLLVAGEFDGSLDNGGETLELSVFDYIIHAVKYDDAAPWAEAADGNGPSLEILNSEFDASTANSWKESVAGGTPGVWTASAASNDRWSDASAHVGVAWRHHPVFGTYFVNDSQFIRHRFHGWIFLQGDGNSGWWFDQKLGWLFTHVDYYPFFYSNRQKGWLYYADGSSGPRWFYDFNSGQWLEETAY